MAQSRAFATSSGGISQNMSCMSISMGVGGQRWLTQFCMSWRTPRRACMLHDERRPRTYGRAHQYPYPRRHYVPHFPCELVQEPLSLVNTHIPADILCHTSRMNWYKSHYRSGTNLLGIPQGCSAIRRARHARESGLYKYIDRRLV